jgi:hypothetical protein
VAVVIVFETHWLTTDNEAGVATGWLDGQLSERGRALALELGWRRRDDGVEAVFASDLAARWRQLSLPSAGPGSRSTWMGAARMRPPSAADRRMTS